MGRVAGVDIVLGHPTSQAGLADPELLGAPLATDAQLLRELTIDTTKDYPPREMTRSGPTSVGPDLADVLRHHIGRADRI